MLQTRVWKIKLVQTQLINVIKPSIRTVFVVRRLSSLLLTWPLIVILLFLLLQVTSSTFIINSFKSGIKFRVCVLFRHRIEILCKYCFAKKLTNVSTTECLILKRHKYIGGYFASHTTCPIDVRGYSMDIFFVVGLKWNGKFLIGLAHL